MNDAHALIAHIEECLKRAYNLDSNLSKDVLALEGMSGAKTRHFYNNVCSLKFEGRDTNYLDIGTWKGSSTISSLYSNEHVRAFAIDNWRMFRGPREDFTNNVNTLIPTNELTVIDDDCFAIDIANHVNAKIDVYLYDGDHQFIDHFKAIKHYADVLNDVSIVMIDDWNYGDVRNGTYKGLESADLDIMYKKEIRHTADDSHSPPRVARSEFWNGIGIFILKKRSSS